jgi:hypothetical protein
MTDTFTIAYKFTLPDASQELFDLEFDAETVEIINQKITSPSVWTELGHHQCPHCPLTCDTHPHCPVAINLSTAIDRFDHLMSFDRMSVEVTSLQRQVTVESSAQEGISSLMGLLIAGSSCPMTHFFKPMARFHLPFANKDETLWRATATFLLALYFTDNGLQVSDMVLDGLVKIYDDVTRLNDYMVERVRSATSKDSAVNALVHLDVFAKFITHPLEDSLNQIKDIFTPLMKGDKTP